MQLIRFISGNIFTTSCQTLVNTVNCVGVMGAGIALEYKYRYPEMFEKYVTLCREKKIEVGKLWIYNVPDKDRKILNFPTKNHWRYPTKLEYLEKGLEKFIDTYKEKNITSIAFPLLGAQNGGIDPQTSKSVMEKYLSRCDIKIEIYEYDMSIKDDLIDKLHDLFTYYSYEEVANLLEINSEMYVKIDKLISQNNFNSLFQLTQNQNEKLSEKRIQKLYNFLVNFEPKEHSESLFSQTKVSEKLSKDKDYKIRKL